MKPHLADPDFRLYLGSALDVLQQLDDESVHCVITSPPYWGLRDYGTGTWTGGDPSCDHEPPGGAGETSTLEGGKTTQEMSRIMPSPCTRCGATRVDLQLGLEPTPDGYVARMVEIFREVRRVLRRDGVCWLNLGDTYFSPGAGGDVGKVGGFQGQQLRANDQMRAAYQGISSPRSAPGLKAKDLVGIPWRVAFALQADGWYLRSDVIWSKPNPMPESVTDRPTRSHEYLFLLTRSGRYFFDPEPVREPEKLTEPPRLGVVERQGGTRIDDDGKPVQALRLYDVVKGANVKTVWTISTQPYPGAHFAVFPQDLVRRCVLAGTSEHGCCPDCGNPWRRLIEHVGLPGPETGSLGDDLEPLRKTNNDADRRRGMGGGHYYKHRAANPDKDLGWQAGCDHDLQPVPCVVLDPFIGSGTTALVARSLGRHCVGIDLNPDYGTQIAERTQQLSLLAEGTTL